MVQHLCVYILLMGNDHITHGCWISLRQLGRHLITLSQTDDYEHAADCGEDTNTNDTNLINCVKFIDSISEDDTSLQCEILLLIIGMKM